MSVRRVELSTSITAVKFVEPGIILSGHGGEVVLLQCTEKNSWEKVARHQVFSYQSTHGIVLSNTKPGRFLAFGGHKFALAQFDISPRPDIKLLWNKQSEDWILDGSWRGSDTFLLMMAHGKLIEVSATGGHIVRSAVCLDRSILYSARIVNHPEWDGILLLSGTVHNQVMLWSPGTSDQPSRTVAVLSGHKGVIFSVKFDQKTQRICSTSDDRTARIWKRKVVGDEADSDSSEATWHMELTLFGNKARVWDSAFLPHSLLATIAEDGGVMVWSDKGECLTQCWVEGGLLCLDVEASPASCLLKGSVPELVPPPPPPGIILCAGATSGSLYLFPVPLHLPLPLPLPVFEGSPRQVCLDNEGKVLCCSSVGKIYMYKNQGGWSECLSDTSLASYCLMSLSQSRCRLAIGDINGNLRIFSVTSQELKPLVNVEADVVVKGRVYSLHWLNEELLLACGPHGSLQLLSIYSVSGEWKLSIKSNYELPQCKERWTTCASLLGSSYFVCGDRIGSIHLYSLPSTQAKPVWSSVRVHGSKGVSCIIECGLNQAVEKLTRTQQSSLDTPADALGFVSCGRDGSLIKFKLVPDDNSLRVLLSIRLPMDWASRIVLSPEFGLLVIGFHNLYFCIWSLRERRHLMKLVCWGGHRSWDLNLSPGHIEEEANLTLTFIKDKSVHYFNSALNQLALPAPLQGLHSKTVNGCTWVRKWGLLVSGGEDTVVRVCEDTTLSALCSVESHISSVRAVVSFSVMSQPEIAVIVTAGARAQLKLWTLSQSGELCERDSHMLRSEAELHQDWRKGGGAPLDQPDIRYMDIAIIDHCDSKAYLYAASSDGYLRVFKVDLLQMSLELVLTEETQTRRCLLKTVALQMADFTLCLISSTDGFVTFYRHRHSTDEIVEVGRWQFHCGGINALNVSKLNGSSSKLLVASGGDDAVLTLSLFSLASDLTPTLVTTIEIPCLHTCQVTGVEILKQYVVSVGLDGRLHITEFFIDSEDTFKAEPLSTYVTSLYDIHGLQAILQRDELFVCLYGLGIEVVIVPLAPG